MPITPLQSFLLFWGVNTLSLWVTSRIVPGIAFRDTGALVVAGLLLGLLNTFVRPILVFLTFPITVITLGLFLIVVNTLVLLLVAALVPGFDIRGFGTGLIAALVISVLCFVINSMIGLR